MNEFFDSLKADLLDRRLLPFAGVALALLLGALGYVALAGGSSSTPPAPAPSIGAVPGTGGISVSQANVATEKAVAETTDGFKKQRKGSSRNPFTPLPGAVATSAAATGSKGTGSSSTSSSGSGSSGTSSGGTTEKSGETKTNKKSSKPKTVYQVTVLFGSLTPDPTTGEIKLIPYVNLKLFTPLPSSGSHLVVFRGVTAGGKAASFTVVGEAILSGEGACLPSAFQCHALDLKPGEAEQMEYLAPGATTVSSYELKVVAIEKVTAKAAAAAHVAKAGGGAAAWQKSQGGWELLNEAGLLEMPYLRQSSQPGVLMFAPSRAHRLIQRGPRLAG